MKKTLDINKQYEKLLQLAEVVFSEMDESDVPYWFDKKRYKFISDSEYVKKENENKRYIQFIQFDTDYSLIDFYIAHIGQKAVESYFRSAPDVETASIRLRKFTDCNISDGKYDIYDAFTDLIVKWCQENDINYSFKKDTPPKDYAFLPENISNYEWEIPDE